MEKCETEINVIALQDISICKDIVIWVKYRIRLGVWSKMAKVIGKAQHNINMCISLISSGATSISMCPLNSDGLLWNLGGALRGMNRFLWTNRQSRVR